MLLGKGSLGVPKSMKYMFAYEIIRVTNVSQNPSNLYLGMLMSLKG